MPATIKQGNALELEVTISLPDETPVDPTTLKLHLRNPLTEEVTTYIYLSGDNVIVRRGVGVFYAKIKFESPGVWWYGYESIGPGEGYKEDYVDVSSANAI